MKPDEAYCDTRCVEKCDKDYQQNQERVAVIMRFIDTLNLEQLNLFKKINKYFYTYRDVIYNKTVKKIEDLR